MIPFAVTNCNCRFVLWSVTLSCLPIPVHIWLYVCYTKTQVKAGSPWPRFSSCASAVQLAVPGKYTRIVCAPRRGHAQFSKLVMHSSNVLIKRRCMARLINKGPSFLRAETSQVLSSQVQSGVVRCHSLV